MIHRQPPTQLEERLIITFLQLVEDRATSRVGKRLEHIGHTSTIGKSLLACQKGVFTKFGQPFNILVVQPKRESKRSFIEESRRSQIVEATVATIAVHGYAAATFTRIARHAEISAGLISYHFDSKEDLMNVTLGTIEQRLDTAMGGGPEPDSYPGALKSMLTRYVRYCTEHKQEMSALAQIRQQAPRGAAGGKGGNDKDELVQFIADGQSYGQFRTADPSLFASVLTNAMGHVPRELELRPESDHGQFADQWSELFVNAISAPEGDES